MYAISFERYPRYKDKEFLKHLRSLNVRKIPVITLNH